MELHHTTIEMLDELLTAAGYENKQGEKGKGRAGVLSQLIYEAYQKRDELQLDRKKQQGFLLAQMLQELQGSGKKIKEAKEYGKNDAPPSYYLKTESESWTKELMLELVKQYRYLYAPETIPPNPRTKASKSEN